ncbi:hypothetical protein [Actinokineospora globicatena]|uniref:Uncharacterized protein n=1 Tax=Actinokineospora globicatena TaxID=103729 RepID=A0A9W6QIP2_9PSEU|nr:hypothetical protein [Actinokineospora globicatena]GLW90405.1 hypothetical protein Aglo03_12210 [Actinokineospora globicatena]
MVYDDDAGPRVNLGLRNEDRPVPAGASPRQPTAAERRVIEGYVNKVGWDVARIRADIRRTHNIDVSLDVILLVVNGKRADNSR